MWLNSCTGLEEWRLRLELQKAEGKIPIRWRAGHEGGELWLCGRIWTIDGLTEHDHIQLADR